MVKAGDIVKVKVMEVDAARKRVSFTMRLNVSPDKSRANDKSSHKRPQEQRSEQRNKQHAAKKPQAASANLAMGNAFADAFAKAKKN